MDVLHRYRYVTLLLLLITSFKLLSFTQSGTKWELSSDIYTEGSYWRAAFLVLFVLEVVLFILDIRFSKYIFNYYLIIYVTCLLFCIWVNWFSFNQKVISLRLTNPLLSQLLSHPFIIGITVSLFIVAVLTYKRLKW